MGTRVVNRRDFLRLSGIAGAGLVAVACGGAAPAAPAPAAAEPGAPASAPTSAPVVEGAPAVRDIPREKTLIYLQQSQDGQLLNSGLGNPYTPGSQGHRAVTGAHEPLFFYSAFADEFIPWIATGFEYNEDYTELVVSIREGVEWSDGHPFTANDVAFMLNALIAQAPILRNSTEVKAWVSEAEAVDELTVRIAFYEPRPRFVFSHLAAKFDTGIYWLPEHVFRDVEDIASFTFYDPEQGWPLYTGPYNVVHWTPQQQLVDRRDDWWAAKIGFADLPEVERILNLPTATDERAAQLVINNEADTTFHLQVSTVEQSVRQNPNVITHSGRESPFGYLDWWPISLWFNCEEPPFNTKEIRWAISYAIDRDQMIEVGLGGAGMTTSLPFPEYQPLLPYFEATAPLLERYPTNEYNLEKSAALMEGQGFTKDGEGFWVRDGARVDATITTFSIFNDVGPVLAEQLRHAGFESEYTTPADAGTRRAEGVAKLTLWGHGGSIRDPFDTLDFFTSKYYRPVGEPATYPARWRNEEYDAILEEMALISPDPNNPAYMDLYLAAIEIWLDELVDAPVMHLLHRIPYNTTYWDNWPTADNPYVNGALWHQTANLVIQGLRAKS
ncbi:MAG: ABC transporter substrate-binding protein [Caldilineaceae bacterium]|nr:ABC transporter substrate-binding protein [Caldilineaceae bacterium]